MCNYKLLKKAFHIFQLPIRNKQINKVYVNIYNTEMHKIYNLDLDF